MRHRTATAAGRALYKLHQQTVEPVFGIIKEVLGSRRFSLRGLAKVSLQWEVVCWTTTSNASTGRAPPCKPHKLPSGADSFC
jgi:hypothetical protein